MIHTRHDRKERGTVTVPLVRDQAKRDLALTLQELEKEALRPSLGVPGLNEDVDYIAVSIASTSETSPFSVDCDEPFVQEPGIGETTPTRFQFSCLFPDRICDTIAGCLRKTMKIPRQASRSSMSRKLRQNRE
jgi:hypothetical protein